MSCLLIDSVKFLIKNEKILIIVICVGGPIWVQVGAMLQQKLLTFIDC